MLRGFTSVRNMFLQFHSPHFDSFLNIFQGYNTPDFLDNALSGSGVYFFLGTTFTIRPGPSRDRYR